jgi:ABC-type uncharacterized transport system YnjBCD ATPase subunit
VREQIGLFARLYPRSQPVDTLIDLVGLRDKATTQTKDLSGGQGQRLAVALALVNDPDLTGRRILEAARVDKKAREGMLRWSLPARIGESARGPAGAWTHEIEASVCEKSLDAALRTASEVPDSPS